MLLAHNSGTPSRAETAAGRTARTADSTLPLRRSGPSLSVSGVAEFEQVDSRKHMPNTYGPPKVGPVGPGYYRSLERAQALLRASHGQETLPRLEDAGQIQVLLA